MKVYDKDGKINFVDENNVFLGYDTNQECCEDAGWFISESQRDAIPPRETPPDLAGYVFDTKFFKRIENEEFDAGGMVIFRVTSGLDEKFVHIYNAHNGYYSHGFEMTVEGAPAYFGTL